VEAARTRQLARYRDLPEVVCNAQVSGRWLDRQGAVDTTARDLLVTAAERMGLSARAYYRVLKVARTIADLDGDAAVQPPHVAEALRSRPAAPRPAERRPVAAAVA
jgi:magnesium chelatase family protein